MIDYYLFIFISAIIGLLANGLIIAMFARFRQLNNPSNLLILSLALVDIGESQMFMELLIYI